jgi:probable rRNA maturation factor
LLSLEICAAVGGRYVPYLKRNLMAAHSLLRPELKELSLVLVGDREMSRLHERFLGHSGPTDVLTFEVDHDGRGHVVAGEVVACVSLARRMARKFDASIERELLLYALHGMLHLCGYDDKSAAGFRAMHAKEDQILTQLAVGPVFAARRRLRAGAGR